MGASGFDDVTFNRLAEVRVAVEAVLLRDAMVNWQNGHGSLQAFDGPLSAMQDAAAKRDSRGVARADVAFHRVIRDASDNDVAGSAWDIIALDLEDSLAAFARTTPDLHVFTHRHRELRDKVAAAMAGTVSLAIAQALCRGHMHALRL
jgi:DNA-binding GntR family transcriptional regulator